MVSEARTSREAEREGESNHPENVSLIMPRQGVLPRQRHFAAITVQAKCTQEDSLKLHGKDKFLGCFDADPGLRRDPRGAQHVSLRNFGLSNGFRCT